MDQSHLVEEEEDLVKKGILMRQRLQAKMKKNMIIKKTPGISQLAQAMRYIICNFMKRQIESGSIKSKFFPQFIICDIISPKCFVVLPKNNIALTVDGKARKLIFKVLNSEDIQAGCGIQNPTDKQISGMIDDWIYMAPQSRNIAKAYEVFKDYMFYMQLTEYCEEYDNIYNTIKQMNLGSLQETLPRELIKLTYLYVIQISHAFMNAHKSGLCHGDFNLTQVICDRNRENFKMINFRPWLISKLQKKSSIDDEPIFTKQELLKIAKSRDLYQFGESIFDMMVGKTSKEVLVRQVIVQQKNLQNQSQMTSYSQQLKKEQRKLNMPSLETIPLIWVKQIESSCLFEIIHMCMIIDVNRDTVDLFTQIHNIASYQYARFFDVKFKPFKDIRATSEVVKNRDFAIGLNNRSVMTRFRILQHGLNRVVSEHENQQVLNFQEQLLQQACKMAYHCDESQLNLCLLQWQRGQLFDDDFCTQIRQRITESLTAQYICLMFRRAIGLSINKMEEKQILPLNPMDPIGMLISDQYKEFLQLKIQTTANFEVHIGTLINQNKKDFVASSDIKKIFFSQNEKFCVLVTANVAVVLQIIFNSFKVLGQIILPNCMKKQMKNDLKHQSPRLSRQNDLAPQSHIKKVVSPKGTTITQKFDMPASPVSEEPSAFQSMISDALSAGQMSPKAIDAQLLSSEEMEKEEKLLLESEQADNRKKRVLCNGYFSSPWVAAIDNKGTTVVLHQMDQAKLVQRTRADDDFDQYASKSKSILTCDNEIKRIYPGMKLLSQLHIFTGDQFANKKVVEIGRLCPDEVLDITFLDEAQQVSEDFDDMLKKIQTNSKVLSDESESDRGLLKSNLKSSRITLELEHQGTAAFNIVTNEPVINGDNSMRSNTQLPYFDQEPSIIGSHLKSPLNQTQNSQSQFSFASNKDQPYTVQVKCKNLLQYTVNLQSVILDQFDQITLTKKPNQMEGGAAIPVSIFNNPNGTKKENISMAKYEKIKNMASLLFQKHSLTDPSYKSKHYDHLKQFIQKQESIGNIIKLAKNNNQYLIGYQQKEYKGRKPHYFVYDILMRKVVRRFLPISGSFSLLERNNNEEGQESMQFLKRSMTVLKEKDKHDSSNIDTPIKSVEEEEENAICEVLNFEVSPNGTFMLQVVEPQLIGLRLLNPGILEVFKDNLQPGYFTQEDTNMVFSDVEQKLSTDLSSGDGTPKHDKIDRKMETFDFGGQKINKKMVDSFFRSSIRFSVRMPVFSPEILTQLQSFEEDPFAKYKQIDESRPLSHQLIVAHQNYENYQGSTYQKHLKFIQFHTLVAKCLSSPELLINPGATKVFTTYATDPDREQSSPLSVQSKSPGILEELNPIKSEVLKQVENFQHNKMIAEEKENAATTIPGGIISARILKKCFFAIQEFHFNYSVLTSMNNMGNSQTNFFSQKVGINSLRKFTTFDQIAFRHNSDKIKQFRMCSLPRNWMFVVYYARVLQIFDQITGAQIFELSVPSAKSFAMIDNEQLIIIQDGLSSVWIATIECQKKAFISKGTAQRKVDVHMVLEYEENQKISEYELGLAHQRQRIKRQLTDQSESNEEEEDQYGGIKLMKWDQEILELVTSGNTALFGYFAFIGKSKVSIFNAYADEESCIYDHIWTIDFINFRSLNIGLSIKKLDIAANCESFCGYTNTGQICIWSIKKMQMESKVYVVRAADRPINRIRSVNNNQTIVTYSKQSNLIMVINAQAILNMKEGQIEDHVLRISPGAEGFGEVVNLQVDNSEQFLICAFTRNKLGVYGIKNGQLLMTVEDSALICEDSFIDETGCYLAAMDKSRKFVNIYTFDWNYKLQLPTPPKPKKDQHAEEQELKRKQEEEKAKELEKKKEEGKKKIKSCVIF